VSKLSHPRAMTRSAIAVLAVLLVGWPRTGAAATDSDVEELRREVRALQVQVQALRTAIAESAELDRQKAAMLTRVLKNTTTAGETLPASKPEPRAELPPAPAPAVPTTSSRRAEAVASAPPRKSAPPPPQEPAAGMIRGRIGVPGGEAVAYVYVENVLAAPVRGQRATIEQSGKRFMPGWAVVQRGTTITFPNKDNIYHNVFSLSPGNSFDLGLYNSSAEAKSHTFSEPGPVDVYCNIHPQMAASVLVVPNRHYAKVKADGTYEIAGVPSGRRKIVAWSPGTKPTSDWVEVAPGAAVDLNLKLDLKAGSHTNKVGQSYGSYE
jgi:plastocyanin